MSMYRIILDPGHGGHDPGATGPTGLQEKDVNLAVAKLCQRLLKPYFEVRLTRTADISVDLAERVKIANNYGAVALVSIHCNSAENPQAYGMEVFTMAGQGIADKLAEEIVKRWGNRFTGIPIRRDLRDGDSDKEANFYVLRKTNMPAVLIELEFISNPGKERLILADPDFQAKAANVIAEAIASFLGVYLHPQQTLVPPVDVATGFKDIQLGRWSAAAIKRLVSQGILHGYPDGTFQPERPVTREEMAVVVDAVLSRR